MTDTLEGFESDELRMWNLRIILADFPDANGESYALPSDKEIISKKV